MGPSFTLQSLWRKNECYSAEYELVWEAGYHHWGWSVHCKESCGRRLPVLITNANAALADELTKQLMQDCVKAGYVTGDWSRTYRAS